MRGQAGHGVRIRWKVKCEVILGEPLRMYHITMREVQNNGFSFFFFLILRSVTAQVMADLSVMKFR